MTRPAAVFLQLTGLVVALIGGANGQWVVIGIGVALVIWGGIARRKRIREQQAHGIGLMGGILREPPRRK